MDIINKISNYSSTSNNATTGANPPQLQHNGATGSGGFMSGINERLGGGKAGEKNGGDAFTRAMASPEANLDL
jgi:hypothetical protein